MCLKNEQRLFRRVTGADALSQQQYYKEHESWVAEFCFGYWAFLFRSFSCSRCVRTARRRDRGNNMEQLEPLATGARLGPQATSPSAVSWPAIIAGAFVAAAVSLVLLTLGSGLGFAAISPWPGHGISATTFVVTSAIWLIVTQWISSGFGGYVAGRLRTRWIEHAHARSIFSRYGARLDHLGGCNRAGGGGVRIVGTVCRRSRGCRVRGVCGLAKHGASA